LYVCELRDDVLFEHPPLDEAEYVALARSLAEGLPRPAQPFWQPPGIALALALTFSAGGDGLFLPRLIQALVGTLTCALVWVLARRCMNDRAALLATLIAALHGMLVFSTAELLPATYAAALALGAIVILSAEWRGPPMAVAAGLLLGVASLFAPTILAFAALVFTAYFLDPERRRGALLFGLSVWIPILPVAVYNQANGGEFVLISTNAGLNFYLGNNERYLETFAIRPGPRWLELTQRPWQEARISGPVASSSWFMRQGMDYWLTHPLDALWLYCRKLWLFFHGTEIVRDTDAYAQRADSSILSVLLGPRWTRLPDGVLMPLALIGLGAATLSARRALRSPWLPPILFVASQATCYAFFLPAARYRVPSMPVLCVFATFALVRLFDSRETRAKLLALAVALALVCALPTFETSFHRPAERELYRGLAQRQLQDLVRSREHLLAATRADPSDARAWMELGRTLYAAEESHAAAAAWERAAACDPWDLEPSRLAAETFAAAGERARAIRALEASIGRAARATKAYAPDHVQLVRLQLDEGRPDAALESLRRAFAADPAYARSHAEDLGHTRRLQIDAPAFWRAYDALMRSQRSLR
ncbi:MAG TPA: glycosyltransferase family 39 protein, partial [Polyangiaceae bacterium]